MRPEDRKPFRGKCPLCGRCGPWDRSADVARAWAIDHLGRRHHLAMPLGLFQEDVPLTVTRTYKPSRIA